MRVKCLIVLILLSILDFSPFPVVGLLAIWIVLTRPAWFYEVVRAIYENNEKHQKRRETQENQPAGF